MVASVGFGRALRARRLFRHHAERLFVVPLDHPVSTGEPLVRGGSLDGLLGELVVAGVDAVVLHKGMLRHVNPARFAGMSLIVHLSAGTSLGPDPGAKCLVTSVDEALALGADGVSVHVNLGSLDEQRQLADLGAVAGDCERLGLPLLAMVYPRGPAIADPSDPAPTLHAAMLAAHLGADIVKTEYPGSPAAMAKLSASCPIPVLVAGGPRREKDGDIVTFAAEAVGGGAAGVAAGRRVFEAERPGAIARRVAAVVHADAGSIDVPALRPRSLA